MGAATAAVVLSAATCVITGWRPWDFGTDPIDRLPYGLACTLPPVACLAVAVATIAAHRFRSPQDIGGTGMTEASSELPVLSAILQNTLEQVALAVPIYLAAAMLLPERGSGSVAAAAILFVLGRIGFARGYRGGAAKRASGSA